MIAAMNMTYPSSNQLVVFTGGIAAARQLLETATDYAWERPVYLLDGGGRVNAYYLAVELFFYPDPPEEMAKNIYRAKAYTCIQIAELLQEISGGIQPMRPVFVLDFLSTFYDEGVPYEEARTMLKYSIHYLQAISQNDPVIVSADLPVPGFPGRSSFFRQLCNAASQVIGA
jgi:hypothetical protein